MINSLAGFMFGTIPFDALVTAPTVRNEKDVLVRHRSLQGTRTNVIAYSLIEAGDIVIVDPVRGEHDGFTYIGGASQHKTVRRDLTTAARRAAHKVAVEAFCVQRVLEISEKGDDEVAKAKVTGRLAIAQKKADLKKISDKDLRAMVAIGAQMDEDWKAFNASLIAPPTRQVMGALDVLHGVRKTNHGGEATVVATTDTEGSEALREM